MNEEKAGIWRKSASKSKPACVSVRQTAPRRRLFSLFLAVIAKLKLLRVYFAMYSDRAVRFVRTSHLLTRSGSLRETSDSVLRLSRGRLWPSPTDICLTFILQLLWCLYVERVGKASRISVAPVFQACFCSRLFCISMLLLLLLFTSPLILLLAQPVLACLLSEGGPAEGEGPVRMLNAAPSPGRGGAPSPLALRPSVFPLGADKRPSHLAVFRFLCLFHSHRRDLLA